VKLGPARLISVVIKIRIKKGGSGRKVLKEVEGTLPLGSSGIKFYSDFPLVLRGREYLKLAKWIGWGEGASSSRANKFNITDT